MPVITTKTQTPVCVLLLLHSLLLAGCGTTPHIIHTPRPVETTHDDGPGKTLNHDELSPDPIPQNEPRSRFGNQKFYEVNGVRYFVMQSGEGYQERGMASWYGKKFHGRKTSSGEPYNMYGMTAAHKTLPLPSYVEVTNLQTHQKAILRINDRGPFHENRIIDLSYAAAKKLDIIHTGTAWVEVKYLVPEDSNNPVASAQPANPNPNSASESHDTNHIYIQTGAFSSRENAERQLLTLLNQKFKNVQILQAENQTTTDSVYRVRIGPLRSITAADEAARQLRTLGYKDYRIIID